MDDRESVLAQIAELASTHGITAEEIRRAMREAPAEAAPVYTSRIFAYVGGIFILCGLGFFIENFWNEMNSASRIILYLGSGLVMMTLAVVFVDNKLYEKAAIPLFLVAALFQSGGIMVAFDELGTGGDVRYAVLAMTLVMLAQMLLIFYVHRLAVLLFLALVFGVSSLGNLFEILGMDWELDSALTGAGILGASYLLDRTVYVSITPFWYFVGAVMMSYGVFELLDDTPVHILYVGFAAFLMYFSTLARSRTLLLVATCAMIGYLSYFTSEYFADSLGWPVALVIIGIIFIGMSVFAVKLSRDYISQTS